MSTHQGLRAWAGRRRPANKIDEKRLLTLCRNKRVMRILIIQVDLEAKL